MMLPILYPKNRKEIDFKTGLRRAGLELHRRNREDFSLDIVTHLIMFSRSEVPKRGGSGLGPLPGVTGPGCFLVYNSLIRLWNPLVLMKEKSVFSNLRVLEHTVFPLSDIKSTAELNNTRSIFYQASRTEMLGLHKCRFSPRVTPPHLFSALLPPGMKRRLVWWFCSLVSRSNFLLRRKHSISDTRQLFKQTGWKLQTE